MTATTNATPERSRLLSPLPQPRDPDLQRTVRRIEHRLGLPRQRPLEDA